MYHKERWLNYCILLQNLVTFLTKNRSRKILSIIFSQISDTRHYWHIGFYSLPTEDMLIHYKAQYECWDRYTDKNNGAQYDVLHFKLPEDHFLLIVMEPQVHQGLIEFYQELSMVREFMHFQSAYFKDESFIIKCKIKSFSHGFWSFYFKALFYI